ncbi:metallophosphoesterase [Bacillaceae bacterium]
MMSDSHGLTAEVEAIVRKGRFAQIVHCGDFCCDRSRKPFSEMILVRGNCDTDTKVPLERTLEWRGVRIFLTHGHVYEVKSGLLRLKYKALQEDAGIVLFGHTHRALCVEEEGVLFINPGSVFRPRGFAKKTVCLLGAEKEDASRLTVKVTFYEPSGKKVPELGGTFTVRKAASR